MAAEIPSRNLSMAPSIPRSLPRNVILATLDGFERSPLRNDSPEKVITMKSAKTAMLPPIVPSRQGSSGATEESGSRGRGALSFPSSNRLIITTKKGVYIWDAYGITEVFRSGSEGIAAAKKIVFGNEMLAVADSQVVVLHDISGGLQRSYRLKGSGGQVRLLKYANESKNLFFTTTLQNSVQSYSLKHSKLLDPTHTHPSPPSVFALSCSSQFLLSTSPAPSTIHLTRLAFNTRPVLLHPQCSSSAVVAAEFHPERENYFCIAFADGTAAVYDANYFYDNHGNGEHRENAGVLGNYGEKAFIRGLHVGTVTRTAATDDGVILEGSGSTADQGCIGPKESGISAVAFVPGRKATVVTVGADGKCCVVDFTQPTKHRAVLLKSWHIRRPATSLSIICSTKKAIIGQYDGADDVEPEQRYEMPNESYYIAVGRSDGRVLLFDLDGKALGEQALNDNGAQIIDLEWTEIGSAPVLPQPTSGSGIRRSPVVKKTRRGPGSPTHREDPLFDFTTPRKALGAFDWEPPSDGSKVAVNTRDKGWKGNTIMEANKDSQQRPTHVNTQSSSATVQRRPIENLSQTETEKSLSFQSSITDGSIPPVPPRPNPKPGGRLSMRRAQAPCHSDTQSTSYPSIVAKVRKVSSSSPKSPQVLSIATPPAKTRVVPGPRKSPSPRTKDFRNTTEVSEVQAKPAQPEDAWLDVPPETPKGTSKISPVSSATSNRSYKTAMSHLYVSESPERSDDTVVDWTVGSPRQPVPTLQITHPSGERPSRAKSKRKGHISLSVSSASAGTSTPTPATSDAAAGHALSRSPAGSPPKVSPSGRPSPTREPIVVHGGNRQRKGHVSLSVSSDSTGDTITPVSSGSDAGLVQYPSLKKSPRIPDLSVGLPDPKKHAMPPPAPSSEAPRTDSTSTDSILQGYAASPAPSSSPPKVADRNSWLVSTVYPELPKPPSPAPPESEMPPQAFNVADKNPWLVSVVYPELPKPPSPPPPSQSEMPPQASASLLSTTVDREPETSFRSAASCGCGVTFKSVLEASLMALREDIAGQFEAQRVWFEGLLRDEEEERRVLEEENRWLRGEVVGYGGGEGEGGR